MIDPTKLMRGAFLALALLFVAPLTGVGGSLLGVEAAQAATVSKIIDIGNSKVDDAAVIKYLALRVGDTATRAKINASVDALQATGLFKTVSVTMQGSTLVVKVTENSIVASVLFEGNQRFYRRQSGGDDRSHESRHGRRRRVSRATSQSITQGLSATPATNRSASRPGSSRSATAACAWSSSIDEGTRNGIAAINFTGNNSISAWTLKSIIRTHETSWLSWLLRDDSTRRSSSTSIVS